MYDKNTPIGKCSNCDCGNRPGPWHNKDCPAWRYDVKLTGTKENINETPRTN